MEEGEQFRFGDARCFGPGLAGEAAVGLRAALCGTGYEPSVSCVAVAKKEVGGVDGTIRDQHNPETVTVAGEVAVTRDELLEQVVAGQVFQVDRSARVDGVLDLRIVVRWCGAVVDDVVEVPGIVGFDADRCSGIQGVVGPLLVEDAHTEPPGV